MSSLEHQQVVKSNALVEASYRLTLREQRIILGCIAQVDRSQPITDEVQYVISADLFSKLANCNINGAYKELKLAADTLFERRLTLFEHPNTGKPRKITMRWVQSVEYLDGAGSVALRFSKDILPYLTELSRQFTRYALSDVAKVNSPHAVRLYELLMQWRETGKRQVSLDWMRERLGLEGKYPVFKDFRRYVVEHAVQQINEHTPITVSWSPHKTGRKVTHLIFSFVFDKPAARLESAPLVSASLKREEMIKGIARSLIEQRAHPGETYEACAMRLIDERRRVERIK